MRVLVTGGGGFLGSAICRLLRQRGDDVRSLARNRYPRLEQLGVEQVSGDITRLADVESAASGCQIVFHVAAKPGIWGSYDDFHRANVLGTQNVLTACKSQKIDRLVHTSSPSVVFDGHDMEGVDESVPYPFHFEAYYPQTKAEAEQLVLAANGTSLATVALRPHLIWGPGDNHLIPRIVARARAGKLMRIGRTEKLVDTVYIDNAAQAHVLATDRLAIGSPIAGKAYFITQGEPIGQWTLINRILTAADLPPVTRTISPRAAYLAGWVLETLHTVFRRSGEPKMTRFVARELSTAHWFDISAARRDLGYSPTVSIDEGLRRLAEYFKTEQIA